MASIARQLLVLAVLAGGAGWFIHQQSQQEQAEAQSRARPAPGVVVAEAQAGEVERVVSAVGTGRALRSVELRFSVGGRVTAIQFRDGDPVEADEPLATLDDGSERAALAVVQAELAEARAAFDRAVQLQDQGRITASTYDSAKAEMLRAEARLDSARADLGHMILRAPFGGVIGFSEIEEGAVVSSSTPVATLDDISQLDVEFMVPERFFGDVRAGAPVRARTRIFPDETFEGVVEAIDRRVDEVSRAFLVRARFDNPGLRLPAGVFMQVDLVLGSRPGVIAPEEALVTEAGEVYLYVVGPDDKVQRRAVTLGGRRAGEAEILEGLVAGERVVVRGVQKVRDGAPVRVLGEAPRTDAGPAAPEARAADPTSAG
ncbi:efflux RND transporter periplasmic adaptor subunit [Albimonas sp. CAU 1670]|uniref:efflux RND transporter periplasmic adaptor subunit n=1 Tax=Albimonas sp. CAU 1670 TaxID=3032599 RepID=UPI0023DB480A|nr:efflux RND transporter periplasmic adaptor subunit [Albimonas sp. CAU 1670]MDF2234267.1 efflux RND transporter periplasmic adaptor subunit [Albimonas sp. CAU 1670]